LSDALVPHTGLKIQRPERAQPADIDSMLAVIPRHAQEKLLPQLTDETREEAMERIAEYCLNLGGKRRTDVWLMLAATLNETYPGLALQPTDMRKFCLRHVLPNIAITRSYVTRAIVERGLSVDTLASTLDVRQKLEEVFEAAKDSLNKVQTDGTGRIVRVGSSADEVAAAAKALLSANKLAGDELERFGLVPEAKKAPAVGVNVNVNMQGGMARLAGKPIDVPFKATDNPAEPTSGA
jgi:hypothetical protein